ncbi:MAG: hypothetical protein JRF63_08505 [Deltaproteobacteria bacterium]|nr:hypothetical protein [Deltaproteobacteria bacterium]
MRSCRLPFTAILGLLLVAPFCTGCGGGPTVLATTPTPGDASEIIKVPPPDGSFELDVPVSAWTPVMIGGDQGAMLGRALADRKAVMMVLGSSVGDAAFEEQVFRMVKAAAPEIAVVARARATLDQLLQERGEIPYRVTMEPSGTDVLGRPYYLPKEHMLQTEWLTKKKALKGAEGLLTVRRVTVDDKRLRELRDRRRGSCGELIGALDVGMSGAKSFFEPYAEAVDQALEKAFTRHLEKALLFWNDELAAARQRAVPGGEDARCIEAYQEFVDRYAPCAEGSCRERPMLVLRTGGLIGMDNDPFGALPDRCPTSAVRDYGGEMKDLASRAVGDVLPHLGGAWGGELMRYGALSCVADGVDELCAPRHRRFSAQDLEAARGELDAFLTKLGGLEADGEWVEAGGLERSPGVGPVAVLARVQARGDDPVAGAVLLLERLRRLERCDEGGERLLQAALVDVGSSEVVFMGIFFEEQLLCEGLPPGHP